MFYLGRSDEINPSEEHFGKGLEWGKTGAWGMAVRALEAVQAALRLNLADGDGVCCHHGAWTASWVVVQRLLAVSSEQRPEEVL